MIGTRPTRVVARPRLSALLDGKPWARLVLVSAPAGFGKSTAVAAWATSAGVRAATVSLRPAHNDLARFRRAVTKPLAAIAGSAMPDAQAGEGSGAAGEDTGGAGEDTGAAVDALLAWLAAASAAADGRRVALVLDDYHLVDDPRIHQVVGQVVERLPPGTLLVIATRADPPLHLSRLRARDELVELRADQLRFTSDETAALLRTSDVTLEPADIAALTDRTEGWAAVLRLAAIALTGRSDPADAVRRFGASHRFVLDYVVEEVLAGLPAATVDFLVWTSILDRIGGDLAEAVTGEIGGQAMLEALERQNLLLVALDDERRWYRYHALFRQVLRGRLQAVSADRVPDLHDRASRWFEAHGFEDEAIEHALAGHDVARAASLVAEASLGRLNAGDIATIRRWLDALGPDVVRRVAQLSLSDAWCHALGGDVDTADARIADAEALLATGEALGPVTGPATAAEAALLRSYVAGVRRDAEAAIAEATRARELIPPGLPPVVEATLRGDATLFIARALLAGGDFERGFQAALSALPDLRAAGNILAIGRTMNDLAVAAVARGEPAAVLEVCERELELTPGMAGSAPYWAAVARIREALGEVSAADAAAERALELAVRAADGRVAAWARERRRLAEAARPVDREARSGNAALPEPLTGRELEVLRLVAEGRSNRQIGRELFVTLGTVKSHVHTISGKLGASNRVEAVAIARRKGLLA
jgi:LuxR family maltose regulon positive regulatory protein